MWDRPKDNGSFTLDDCKLTVSVNDAIQQTASVNDTKFEFASSMGLDNDMVKFSLSASNVLGIGPECASSVRIPYRMCITPKQDEGNAATRKSIIVDCDTVPGVNPKGPYVVYYSANGLTRSIPGVSLPIEISMLAENTEYEILVEAENSDGKPENSTMVLLKTNAPGPPANVILKPASVEPISDSSVTVNFTSVTDAGLDNGTVTHYRVYLNGEARKPDYDAQPGNIQRLEIKDLVADTLYEIRVAAVNDLGVVGEQSDPATVRTNELPGGLGVGAFVGVAIAILVLIAVVILMVVLWKCCYFKYKKE
eukprot:m.220709 g.220709  ORF g.220709 m.220709 type:complete len:309 (+) comp39948_c0_seq3:113-1039(+)